MAKRRAVQKHEVAKRSLDKISDYLAREASLRVALRFLERAEETFERLLQSPGLGHLQEFRSLSLGDVLAWRVRGFRKWLVYYRELDDGIEVLDVMHGAQDQEARLAEKFEDDDDGE